MDIHAEFTPVDYEIAGRTVKVLETQQYVIDRSEFNRDALYQDLRYNGMEKCAVRFIPYYAWDNREYGEMRIWFPVAYR